MGFSGRARGYLSAFLGAFSVWWAAPLVKLAAVDPYTAVWWRFAVGSAATIVTHRLVCPGCSTGFRRPFAWLAGFFLALHMLLWFESLEHTTVLASTAIVCTYPVFNAVVDAVTGRIPAWKAAGIALVLVSSVLMMQTRTDPLAVLEALASSLAATAYFQLLRFERIHGLNATGLASTVYMIALFYLTLLSPLYALNPLAVPVRAVPYLIALGIVPTLIGHTLLNYSLVYLPPSIVTSLVITEPPGATLLAYLLLGEKPTTLQSLYSGLAVTATLIALLPQNAIHRLLQLSSQEERQNAPG